MVFKDTWNGICSTGKVLGEKWTAMVNKVENGEMESFSLGIHNTICEI